MTEVCKACNRQMVSGPEGPVCPDCGAGCSIGLPRLALLVAALWLLLAAPSAARGHGPTGGGPTPKRDISDVIGLDTKTGHVSNETESAWKFELGSSALYTLRRGEIKLALSPAFWRSGKWKAAADIGENLMGISLNHDVIPVIRIAVGAGVARDLDADNWTVYLKGSFRAW